MFMAMFDVLIDFFQNWSAINTWTQIFIHNQDPDRKIIINMLDPDQLIVTYIIVSSSPCCPCCTNPLKLHFEPLSLHCEGHDPLFAPFKPLKLLFTLLKIHQDPGFHSNANPDPASKICRSIRIQIRTLNGTGSDRQTVFNSSVLLPKKAF